MGDRAVLQASRTRLTIPTEGDAVVFCPESMMVIEANRPILTLLDIAGFGCTFGGLKRRARDCGLDASDEEFADIVETLVAERCLAVDGEFVRQASGARARVFADQGLPKTAALHVTYRCNLKCTYCYNSGLREHAPSEELSLDQWRRIVGGMIEAGVRSFDITGGEPLFRQDLFPLFAEMKNAGCRVGLITNGTLLDEAAVGQIGESATGVVVSVDSWSPDENDSFRGPGTHAKATSAIRRLVERGVRVSANAALTDKTIDAFQQTKAFLNGLGCSGVTPIIVQPYDEATLLCRPSRGQLERALDENCQILTSECGCEEFYRHSKTGWVGKKAHCGAGTSECSVGQTGVYTPAGR